LPLAFATAKQLSSFSEFSLRALHQKGLRSWQLGLPFRQVRRPLPCWAYAAWVTRGASQSPALFAGYSKATTRVPRADRCASPHTVTFQPDAHPSRQSRRRLAAEVTARLAGSMRPRIDCGCTADQVSDFRPMSEQPNHY